MLILKIIADNYIQKPLIQIQVMKSLYHSAIGLIFIKQNFHWFCKNRPVKSTPPEMHAGSENCEDNNPKAGGIEIIEPGLLVKFVFPVKKICFYKTKMQVKGYLLQQIGRKNIFVDDNQINRWILKTCSFRWKIGYTLLADTEEKALAVIEQKAILESLSVSLIPFLIGKKLVEGKNYFNIKGSVPILLLSSSGDTAYIEWRPVLCEIRNRKL